MKKPRPPSVSGGAVKQRRWVDPILHRLYYRGAGVHQFIARRCRPAGVALVAILGLTSCLAVAHTRASIYQVFSLSFGMVLIGIFWAMSRRASVRATRQLPRFATAGEPMSYHIRIWNTGKRQLNRAWLSDSPPDSRPGVRDFVLLREPGEEERNGFDRRLAYFRWRWLLLGNRLFNGGLSKDDISVKQGQHSQVVMELVPLRRGVIRFNDLRILLPDPFGLFQRSRKVSAPQATLTVLPRRYPLPPIELPGGAAFKVSGETNTNSIGTSGEFVGLRDYRPGDPLRQIHWKSWARTGRPIVKELEDTFYPRYGLVVDTLSVARTDRQFEEAISVAASFAASIDTSESLLDLMFINNEAHIVTAGRGVERAEKLLEVLAAVSPEREENYDVLAKLVIRHRDDLTACIVILNGWDETRLRFIQTLTKNGVVCAPIIIGIGAPPEGIQGNWLESGQIARDLQRLPARLAAKF